VQNLARQTPFLGVNAAVKRILLVEDEPTTREILAEVLRGEGYTVDTVAAVSAANVCLKSLAYELVVSDWLLPDGDGVAVADAAAALGFKTLIVSGVISELPGDAHLRHRLILKSLGPLALVSAVRAAIGGPCTHDLK
jgi:CheY-like chemotaxis protein